MTVGDDGTFLIESGVQNGEAGSHVCPSFCREDRRRSHEQRIFGGGGFERTSSQIP